jgi:EmrB/QacA subfamily drug resistance transporter
MDIRPKTTPDYRRKWAILAAVGMGIFLATIDSSIVNVALPTLVEAFDTQFATVQWVVLSYLLTLATLLLSIGRWADIIGKKPIYLFGMLIFSLGSFLCGISMSVYWLIAFRVVQAIGAAMMISLGAGIITEAFPLEERGKALGVTGSIVSIGIITGPSLGGIIIDLISWNWIFFVNLPVGIVGSVMVYRFIPPDRKKKDQHFDFYGAATLFISLLAFLLALTLGQRTGFTNQLIIALFAIWLIFLILFLLIEFRIDQPMVDMKLFKNHLFSLNLFTGFILFVCLGGTIILMPFYLQNVLGYPPRQVGLLLAIVPLAGGITSPLAGTLSDRFGTRPISTIGLIVILIGAVNLLSLDTDTNSLRYILYFLPVGLGIGIFQSPNNSAIMSAAPSEKLGIASSLLSLTRTLGQTSGIAALGAFWVSRVSLYAGNEFKFGASRTDPEAQVAGLHDAVWVVITFISIAIVLSVRALYQERKEKSVK